MDSAAQLEAMLATVRRRILTHLLVHQTIYAACFGLAALIVLLLVGTQILNWYWPVLLFVTILAIGTYRFRHRLPTMYETAQRVDRKLSLADAISTAYHFRSAGDGIASAQRLAAAGLIPSIDIPTAVPLAMPRSIYPAAVLALAAGTMLAARYGMMHSLDLEKPLVTGALEFFKPSAAKQLAKLKQNNPLLAKELEKLGISLDDTGNDQEKMGEEKLPDNLLSSPDIPDVNDLTPGRDAAGKAGEVSKDMPQEPGEAGEKGDQANASDGKEGSGSDADNNGKQQKQDGAAQQPKNQDAKNANQNGSQGDNPLMDKMRDALANMMNKLKTPNKENDQQQSQQGQKGNQKDGQKMAKDGQQQSGQNSQKGEQQGEQAGDGGDKSQDAQGQGSDKTSSDAQASPDAKSGVGKSDGNKDTKYSEQLNAMGKISEIMGKRAENIKGDVMVEVSSGRQQLRTQYSQSGAAHASTGGEIHRDEVPLEHQAYVQKYFEEIRKGEQAAAAKKN